MKAFRYTLFYIIILGSLTIFGRSYLPEVPFHYKFFAGIGICILVGLTELIEIFDDIRKNTSEPTKESKESSK